MGSPVTTNACLESEESSSITAYSEQSKATCNLATNKVNELDTEISFSDDIPTPQEGSIQHFIPNEPTCTCKCSENILAKVETIEIIILDIYNHQLQSHLFQSQSLPSPSTLQPDLGSSISHDPRF